ncbi:MAG: mevalonate kinase [Alphaproteobacteria bacterium]|nr:mevalonate kinase [Alphaproteobacteria bacterium]
MKGTAGGKLILCGEHAVVYGHPAIAIPVDMHTTVEYEPRQGALVVEHDLWSPRDEDRLDEALSKLFPDGGAHLKIESDLPIGVGLGSSAALSVAVARAMGATTDDDIAAKAMEMERVFHGDPSGLDVAVAMKGETLWFIKGKPIRTIPSPPCAIVAIDSGTSGDTAQMVQRVKDGGAAAEEIIDDIGALVHAARGVIEDPRLLGELLSENHRHLRKLGVSTPTLDQIVDLCLAAKAYGAKLSGSGGGGVVLALVDDPEPVLRSAEAAGFEGWTVRSRD